MNIESARNKTVTTEHISLAHAVAIQYRSLHPRLDQDDSISIANTALVELFSSDTDSYPTNKNIASAIECALRAELLRLSKRTKREAAIEADEFGEPLFSIRELRTSRSLNPRACKQDDHAPLGSDFVAAIGEVCESAVRQNQPTHPLHAEYVGSAGVSRDLVAQSLAESRWPSSRIRKRRSKNEKASCDCIPDGRRGLPAENEDQADAGLRLLTRRPARYLDRVNDLRKYMKAQYGR